MNTDSMPVRMLVVDDDDLSLELISLLSKRQGYQVEAADSGEAALLHLRESVGSPPNVILVDLQMPGLSGSELARHLRAQCGANTVLLAMSATKPPPEAVAAFDGFLLKPFSMNTLAEMIAGRSTSVTPNVPNGQIDGNSAVLDGAVHAKLSASMKAEKLQQLYALCLSDAERRIAIMRRAASEGDDPAYRREAHSIKGGCGMVGAVELHSLATSMEIQGIAVTNHVATLDEFLLACERLHRILVELENRG